MRTGGSSSPPLLARSGSCEAAHRQRESKKQSQGTSQSRKSQKKEAEPEQKKRKRVQGSKAPVDEKGESVRSNAEEIDLCVSGESDCESVVILDDCKQTDTDSLRVQRAGKSFRGGWCAGGAAREVGCLMPMRE